MSLHDQEINADPFNLEPQIAAGKLRVLRQSTIGTADTCLHRLEYDLDPNVAYSTGETRAVGTAYHRALECYYRDRQAGGPVKPTEEQTARYLVEAFDSFDLEAQSPGFVWQDGAPAAKSKIDRMLLSYFANDCYWPDGYEVLGVEYTFLYELKPGWAVKGTTDLILRDPNGWVIIVDHKSAKRKWKKGKEGRDSTNQPAWYQHYVGRLFETDSVAFVFDIMTYDGEFERRPADVDEAWIHGVLAKAYTLTNLITAGGPFPPNTSSFLCDARWCDYWARCPWGAVFHGQEVAVEITPAPELVASVAGPPHRATATPDEEEPF